VNLAFSEDFHSFWIKKKNTIFFSVEYFLQSAFELPAKTQQIEILKPKISRIKKIK
jgi:hypothetical protein